MRPSLSCHHFGDRPSKLPPREPEARARKGAPPRSSATARRNWSAARCLSSPCGAPLATNSRSSSRPGPRRSRPRLRDRPPHHDTQRLALSACVDCPAPLARCATPRRVREPPRGTTERLARHPAAFRPRISDRPAQVVRARVDQPADEHARRHRDRPPVRRLKMSHAVTLAVLANQICRTTTRRTAAGMTGGGGGPTRTTPRPRLTR